MIKSILKRFLRNPLRKLLGLEQIGMNVEDLRKKGVKIGKNCHIEGRVIFDHSHCWHISIGDHVGIAPDVYLICHDGSTKCRLNYTRIGKINIGNHVFIGARSIIMPNTTIGDNTIIGAGSVVATDIPSGVVAAGNPAHVICSIDDFYKKNRKRLTELPCFGEEYTVAKHVTQSMKDEMNSKMIKGEAFVK